MTGERREGVLVEVPVVRGRDLVGRILPSREVDASPIVRPHQVVSDVEGDVGACSIADAVEHASRDAVTTTRDHDSEGEHGGTDGTRACPIVSPRGGRQIPGD